MNSALKLPACAYRLQFNREFTFRQATALIPYLAALGITHCYASPYLRARPGSMHGYDIIDHNALNPEIGSIEDYNVYVDALHRHGMGQVLDIVPNHMGVMGSDNAWWLDVLENGEASDYAEYFDIDWSPLKDELRGKVLIPVLEDQYGTVLESGAFKLTLDAEHGEFSLFYHSNRFPIAPREYPRILGLGLDRLQEKLGATNENILELQSIGTALSHLPERRDSNAGDKEERNREKEVQKRRLAGLCDRSVPVREFLEQNVRTLNGTVGDPRSFDPLHELIKVQAYRLAQWRVATDDINYRRFFDIDDLAALRQENPAVFAATHRFVFELIAQGKVNGLRVDHPDGLYDPARYFHQLQSSIRGQSSESSVDKPCYVIIEKILAWDEPLRKEWPVHGTTGYDFANLVNGLFVDSAAASKMERIYHAFVGYKTDFHDLVYSCKKLILKLSLASELNVLANALSRLALSDRHTCDFTLNSLRGALAEVIASFPVYRTYVSPARVSSIDHEYIELAITLGRKRSRAGDLSVFDFIHRMLLLETNEEQPEWYRKAIARFAMKFQQVTSAVMAKGLEDTALYRYHRLASLNEVGGDPSRFGTSVEEFHRANQQRQQDWPASMLATSTHDSKRSEDVRLRINVLSEIPALWRLTLRRWKGWNRGKKRMVDGIPAPSRNDEYLLYQTLVGAWPLEPLDSTGWQRFSTRIERYILKAMREAKENTSWVNPNAEYEDAMTALVKALLRPGPRNRFMHDAPEFCRRIARSAMLNGLSQTLLKLTSPGVPDIYQGNELWEFNLVDPDNRRPVDYERHQVLLREIQSAGSASPEPYLSALLDTIEDGRIKLFVIWKTLEFRKQCSELFQLGGYRPLAIRGPQSRFLCAFAREHAGQMAVIAVPRLNFTLLGDAHNPIGPEVWGNTSIEFPSDHKVAEYRNIFTGEVIESQDGGGILVSSLLSRFPIALLASS